MAPLRLARSLFVALVVVASGCKTPEAQRSAPQSNAAEPINVPAPKKAPARNQPIHLSIVATNDLHGWVNANETKLPDGSIAKEGGLPVFASYLRILRESNPNGVLLLDGGDLFQGTLPSNLTEGEVVIDAMNELGYDASSLGNHEFDYGPVGPVSVATEEGMDPFGALKARMKQAKFPMLAVNIYDAHSGARPDWVGNDGTLMVERKGVKIGIVGLITPTTPYTTNPVNVATLRFGSLVPEAVEAAKRLRDQGAELVIGVAHAGGRCSHFGDPHDLSTCDTNEGEVFQLLQSIPEGTFDAMVAGHTHAELANIVHGVPVVETRALGRAFATIELYLDPQTHKPLIDRTKVGRNISICAQVDEELQTCDAYLLKKKTTPIKWVPAKFEGQPITPDAQLQALIDPALQKVKQEQQRKLGVTAPRALVRNYEAESALGDFLADSLRQMENADVALLNPGGLRADLRAGEISYGDVYEVIPFDNSVSIITVTGEELIRLLHAAYGGHKGVFQVSGLKVTLAGCPGRGRMKAATLANGKPIVPEKRYRVVVPDFLARGGDGLGPVVQSLPPGRIDLGMSRPLNFREALVDYWKKKGEPLEAPAPGRITILGAKSGCADR